MRLTIKQKIGAVSVLVIAVVMVVLIGIFYTEKQEVILWVSEDGAIFVADPEGGVYPVNEILVMLERGTDFSDMKELVALVDGVVTIEDSFPEIDLYVVRVPTRTIKELQDVRDILERDERVKFTTTNNATSLLQ